MKERISELVNKEYWNWIKPRKSPNYQPPHDNDWRTWRWCCRKETNSSM